MARPTLQQLAYLVALDDHRHFGRAAEACRVSQPGLSGQLRELERILGATLVERGNRRILPTAIGSVVIERARAILRDADDLIGAARHHPSLLRGPLELGVIPTVAPYLLPDLIPLIRNAHPECEMRLHEYRTDELLRRLREGNLDLALLALPVAGNDIVAKALVRDAFLLALTDGHPLAGSGPLPVGVVAGLPMILLEEGHCLRDQALAVCRLAGTHAQATVQATSLATLCQMVAAGLGATLLPACAVALEARPGAGITTRPFRDPAPSRTIGLAWRRTSPNGAIYAALATLLVSAGHH